MKFRELLNKITDIQENIGASKPYLCGGTPRDRYLKKLQNLSDIDITTGDKSVGYLAQETAISLQRVFNIKQKTMDDGHMSIYFNNIKLDFSSNFNTPNIDKYLSDLNIKNPTEMQKEMFSRDFTCNALLLDFDLKSMSDPTEMGFKDLQDKKIRTCLKPEITLTSNKNRVIRSIYLASKLDFDLDGSIIDFVRKNPNSLYISSRKSLKEKLQQAFKYNSEKTSSLITDMNLWTYIPLIEEAYPFYMKIKGKNAF